MNINVSARKERNIFEHVNTARPLQPPQRINRLFHQLTLVVALLLLGRCVDPVGALDIYELWGINGWSYNTATLEIAMIAHFFIHVLRSSFAVNYQSMPRSLERFLHYTTQACNVITFSLANFSFIIRIFSYQNPFLTYGLWLLWVGIYGFVLIAVFDIGSFRLFRSMDSVMKNKKRLERMLFPRASFAAMMPVTAGTRRSDSDESSAPTSPVQSPRPLHASLNHHQQQQQLQSKPDDQLQYHYADVPVQSPTVAGHASPPFNQHSNGSGFNPYTPDEQSAYDGTTTPAGADSKPGSSTDAAMFDTSMAEKSGSVASLDISNKSGSVVSLLSSSSHGRGTGFAADPRYASRKQSLPVAAEEDDEQSSGQSMKGMAGANTTAAAPMADGVASPGRRALSRATSTNRIGRSQSKLLTVLIFIHTLGAVTIGAAVILAMQTTRESRAVDPDPNEFQIRIWLFYFIHIIIGYIVCWYSWIPRSRETAAHFLWGAGAQQFEREQRLQEVVVIPAVAAVVPSKARSPQ